MPAAAAFLALAALLRAAGSTAQEFYGPPEGCAQRAKTQAFCPRYFRNVAAGSLWLPYDINRPGSRIPSTGPTPEQLNSATTPTYLDAPQEVPCVSNAASCKTFAPFLRCEKRMLYMDERTDDFTWRVREWHQLIPGSPAVCGHGNREFSFFVRPESVEFKVDKLAPSSLQKVLLVFVKGGICWDAQSCGDATGNRMMASGNNPWTSHHGRSPSVPERLLNFVWNSGEGKVGLLNFDDYPGYDAVIIPDCTGDMNLGNRSYTYDAGKNNTCITAHHRGGINTGLVLDWVVHPRNSKALQEILILATGFNEMGRGMAFGGHGPAFWASYIQKRRPDVKVRVVVEQALGLNGPTWSKAIAHDPWGVQQLHEPKTRNLLLPPPSQWSLALDDMTSYYALAAKAMPRLAFADVSTLSDMDQIRFFERFGGREKDCCVDGCVCAGGGDDHIEAGQLDWLKTLKIAVLQRHQRLGLNYRSWLSRNPIRFFMLATIDELDVYLRSIGATQWLRQADMKQYCPKVRGSSNCPMDENRNSPSVMTHNNVARAIAHAHCFLHAPYCNVPSVFRCSSSLCATLAPAVLGSMV